MKILFLTLLILSNTLYADVKLDAALEACGASSKDFNQYDLANPETTLSDNQTKCICNHVRKSDSDPNSLLKSNCNAYLAAHDNNAFEIAALSIDSAALLACAGACINPNPALIQACNCLTFMDGAITLADQMYEYATDSSKQSPLEMVIGTVLLAGGPFCGSTAVKSYKNSKAAKADDDI